MGHLISHDSCGVLYVKMLYSQIDKKISSLSSFSRGGIPVTISSLFYFVPVTFISSSTIRTRPESYPNAIMLPWIATRLGRYSGGSRRILSPFRLTQFLPMNTNGVRLGLERATLLARYLLCNIPLSVRRNVESSENARLRIKGSRFDADASVSLFGEKGIVLKCPLMVSRIEPDWASHSLTGSSLDADASVLLFGEKAIALIQLKWPSRVCSKVPKPTSHSLTVLSSDTDASILLSGEKARKSAKFECLSFCNRVLKLASHSSIVPSPSIKANNLSSSEAYN